MKRTLKTWIRIRLREELPERIFELKVISNSQLSTFKSRLNNGLKSRGFTLIGPTNSANQATAWARALGEGKSLRISSDPSQEWFTTDFECTTAQRSELDFRINLLHSTFMPARSILIESLRPIFAFRKGRQGFAPRHSIDDLILLRRMGKKVGVIFHGSDIRDPFAHAMASPFSPFRSEGARGNERETLLRPEAIELSKKSEVLRALLPKLRRKKIPVFITTPDLFHEVPDAHWLPAVVDIDKFEKVSKESPIFSDKKLRVLYIPSRSWIKSSHVVVPILEKLAAEGVIEYRNWLENGAVKHDQMAEIIAASDVVIDQFIGLVGVFALESALAGRVVMSYIDERHSKYPMPPHINVTPDTLEQEVRKLAHERDSATLKGQAVRIVNGEPTLYFVDLPLRDGIKAGIDFVHHYHDGSYSAKVIREVIG